MRKPTKPESRVKIRKWMGDDRYSWALFIDGRVKWDGMSQNEARWRKEKEIEELKKELQ